MMKYMITITKVLDDNTHQTLGLNISQGAISVNCPKSTGIEVEAIKQNSHFELVFKLPHHDHELHFQCKDSHMSDIPKEDECDATLAVCTETHLVQKCQLAA